MQFKGIVKEVLEPRSGVSAQSGKAWKSQDIVVEEANEQYPNSIVASFFGIDRTIPAVGQYVELSFDLRAQEWQGKWFLKASAWKCDVIDVGTPAVSTVTTEKAPAPAPAQQPQQMEIEDLPF